MKNNKKKDEIDKFIFGFNHNTNTGFVFKSAITHFWLIKIHPVDAGNGRITRAISDELLARSAKGPERFYGMPSQMLL